MQGNTTATGTFWVMEMSEKLSKEMKQDVQHLCGNSALSGIDFDHQEVTLGSVLHANTQAAHYVGQKTFFVLTHAGLGSAPWIGGLDLASFAKALVSKYGLQNLQGGTLCLLVCFVGQELAALATELKSCGVNNLTLYSPTDFMFISKGGIPHVYEGESKGTEAMNKLVAKYDVDWFSLCNEGFRPTGYGWACSIIDNGQVKAGSKFARWVLETFDPGEDEA